MPLPFLKKDKQKDDSKNDAEVKKKKAVRTFKSKDPKLIIRFAIDTNTPVKFDYSSKKSIHFKGEETPEHVRIVQPVVLGTKITKNGAKTYFRGYLLGKYSYSQNADFGGDLDNNKKAEYWRIYELRKVKNLVLWDKWRYRFNPSNHAEYNPEDKWFDKITYKMPKEGREIDQKVIMENLDRINDSRNKLNCIIKENDLNITKYTLYGTSENEEIGFIENNQYNINWVWVNQSSKSEIIEALKQWYGEK
jgi:hypothetical protein